VFIGLRHFSITVRRRRQEATLRVRPFDFVVIPSATHLSYDEAPDFLYLQFEGNIGLNLSWSHGGVRTVDSFVYSNTSGSQPAYVLALVNRLYSADGPMEENALIAQLLILEAVRLRPKIRKVYEPLQKSRSIFLETIGYCDLHFAKKLTRELIAAQLQISPSYMNALFRRNTGLSIMAWLQVKRLEIARMLLSHTRDDVATVASKCGYRSRAHFSYVFKRHHGVTPRSFRKIRQSSMITDGAEKRCLLRQLNHLKGFEIAKEQGYTQCLQRLEKIGRGQRFPATVNFVNESTEPCLLTAVDGADHPETTVNTVKPQHGILLCSNEGTILWASKLDGTRICCFSVSAPAYTCIVFGQ
jgi:AraC-like DNA-binding protein